MSFDERAHRGYQLIGPVLHHSNACAVGSGLSLALAQAYCFGQTQARLIGTQTYRLHLDAPGIYTGETPQFSVTNWVDIARFKRYLPTHAATGLFEIWGRVAGEVTALVSARIIVHTETGDAFSQEVSAGTTLAGLIYGSDASRAEANRALYDQLVTPYSGATLFNLRGSVDLSPLSGSLGSKLVVTVQAKCVDAETAPDAVARQPDLVQARWESE